MTSEIIIDAQEKEISIALLEDKNLVEYQTEPRSASFSVGNVYIAKVKKLMPGLNACFVDLGYERDAFLHYLDLGSQFNSYDKYLKQVQSDRKRLFPFSKATKLPDIKKDNSIQNTLSVGQEVLVQIVKEPISTKGPRLTGELSFAGRYLVLIPFSNQVSVSSKIKSGEERARLKQLIHSIKPQNCGVIVRTVAEGKRVAELDAELKRVKADMAKVNQSDIVKLQKELSDLKITVGTKTAQQEVTNQINQAIANLPSSESISQLLAQYAKKNEIVNYRPLIDEKMSRTDAETKIAEAAKKSEWEKVTGKPKVLTHDELDRYTDKTNDINKFIMPGTYSITAGYGNMPSLKFYGTNLDGNTNLKSSAITHLAWFINV